MRKDGLDSFSYFLCPDFRWRKTKVKASWTEVLEQMSCVGLRPGAVVRGYIQVGLTEGTNWNRTAQIKGLEKSLFFIEFSAAMRFHVYLCNIFSAKLGKAQATQASAEHMSSCFVKDVKRKKKKYKITILETFFFFLLWWIISLSLVTL